jgi:phosphosulfolactate phosphohydrolase-like enzyme
MEHFIGQVMKLGKALVYAKRHFSLDDMYFAGALASLATVEMENVYLYEDEQKSFDMLRRESIELDDRLAPAAAESCS